MKELTIEQKAKAYDEAVENMRKFRDALNNHEELDLWVLKKEIVKDIEYYFPELKENEDEKIRKDIISYLRNEKIVKRYISDIEFDKWIAWLEKQGESIKIKKGKNYLCTKTHKYAGVEWIKGTKYYASDNYTLANQGCEYYCPEYSKEEHNNLFEEVKCDGCVEKQGNIVENLSTNTSIEDDVRRRSTIQVLEYARSLDTYNQYGKTDIDKNIAWLEKQGKQKPFDYENINIQQKDFAPKSAIEAAKEKKIDNANKVEPKDYNSIDPHFGKPADKVEPKFHEGEWVVSPSNLVYKITHVYQHSYMLHLYNDDYTIFETESWYIDEKYHLWTIQDAKDGDVLATDKSVFIYAEVLYNKPYAYCGVDKFGVFKDNCREHDWTNSVDNIHPATKEQRDTLERAMADAGWEFDFEKKELKKIKLKSDDEVEHLIPQKGIYYTCIKDYYSSDNTHLCIKGNIYKSSFNGYIDDESHFGLSWTNSCTEKYFEPTKDEDWIVCEHDNVIGKPMQYKEFKEKVNQKFIENLKSQGLTPKLRLWNLQDAKAGDVLAINWHEGDDSWEKIIIFKKYHNKGVKGLYSMPCVEGYGNTFKNGKIAIKEEVPYYSTTWTCNLHPATKEQRDTLKRAMTNAGWEFDFEKKELKKIEESENIKEISFNSEKASEEYIAWLKSLKQRIGG